MFCLQEYYKMENKELILLVFVLFATFLMVRVSVYFLMDSQGYNEDQDKNNESSKTITAFLRDVFGVDVHHIHLGILLLVITIPLILLGFVNFGSLIIVGIGASLTLDQIFPLFGFGNYFGLPMILSATLSHLIFAEIVAIHKFNSS